MKRYQIKVLGKADMLMNRLGKDLLDEIKEIPNQEKDKWEDVNWKRKAYIRTINGKEEFILPERVLHSTLLNAAKVYRVPPPRDIGRTWSNYIKSAVLIEDCGVIENVDMLPFGCMVNGNPSSAKKSSKVWKIRPLIVKGWKSTFIIIDVGDRLELKTVEGLCTTAGSFVGFCDWRPMYGRFSVVEVEEVN